MSRSNPLTIVSGVFVAMALAMLALFAFIIPAQAAPPAPKLSVAVAPSVGSPYYTSAFAPVGGTITERARIRNSGDLAAVGVAWTAYVPDGFSVDSITIPAASNCAIAAVPGMTAITCITTTLNPGQSKTLTIVATRTHRPPDGAPTFSVTGSASNHAVVSASETPSLP